MERLVDIIGIVALAILAWQDFRTRKIAWWLLPIIAGVLCFFALQKNSVVETGKVFSLNLVFLLLQFLLVWIWFSLKQKKWTTIIDQQIGLGDVLFMICLALAFSPANFLIFYTVGMILTLAVALLARTVRIAVKSEIPLAGALALPLIGLCCWRMIDPHRNFYSDEWVMKWLENTTY